MFLMSLFFPRLTKYLLALVFLLLLIYTLMMLYLKNMLTIGLDLYPQKYRMGGTLHLENNSLMDLTIDSITYIPEEYVENEVFEVKGKDLIDIDNIPVPSGTYSAIPIQIEFEESLESINGTLKIILKYYLIKFAIRGQLQQ